MRRKTKPRSTKDLMIISEEVLGKLWLNEEEDKAWNFLSDLPEIKDEKENKKTRTRMGRPRRFART